jgi:hypothetical protein
MVDAPATGSAVEPITLRTRPVLPPPPLPELAAAAAEPNPAPALAQVGTPAERGPASVFDLDPPAGSAAAPAPAPAGPERKIPAGPPLEPPAPLVSAWGEPLAPDSPELAFRVVAAPGPGPAQRPQEPKPTRDQILQAIQAEAQQKKAEQMNLEREVALSKFREMADMFQRTQAERVRFHEDLRRVLNELGSDAGPEIKALCERYGRDMPAGVEKAATLALNRSAAGAKREVRIARMRAHGFPEAMILDDLAREVDSTRNTRGGPRNSNDVRVIAARLLLRYPPPAPRPVPAAPTTGASAAALRPVRPTQ